MSDGGTPESLIARLKLLSGIGYSDDGLIKVTVNGIGEPERVLIDRSAMRAHPSVLGEKIVTAVKDALADLHGQTVQEISGGLADAGHIVDPGSLDAAARQVTRQAAKAMAQFEGLHRSLMDRLPGSP